VELCSRKGKDGEYYFLPETVDNAVALIRELMEKYNVPPERVIRHYDVTGKICPAPFVGTGIEDWKEFKEEIAMKRYNTVQELPTWARPTVQKLIDKGFLNGTDTGLDLTHDNVRMLVILDRAGVFGE
jgi:N-acetylmuramoyl-L-alanine amidase